MKYALKKKCRPNIHIHLHAYIYIYIYIYILVSENKIIMHQLIIRNKFTFHWKKLVKF